mmetsp:Transcript_27223/g.84631  ORF Transcript_27223/g.84631 Transcript_27223/m.84631 type:complete len:308 (+) Transcript_27223:1228-2151(+)
MVVVDLPSPAGVGLMPQTTTSLPDGAARSRSTTAAASTLALWRPQGSTSPGNNPALPATRSIGSGVQLWEISMSRGTGRFLGGPTAAPRSPPGNGGVTRRGGSAAAQKPSCRESSSADDTRFIADFLLFLTVDAASSSVFWRSMQMVMGPTPPGTGVILDATRFAAAYSTSPTRRLPDLRVASGTKFVPTSTTTQPGLSHAPFTKPARPTAATTTSASLIMEAGSFVREWTTVTVASLACKSAATGMPTMLDRPTTTALLPESTTPDRSRSARQPLGVHATADGRSPPRRQSLPTLSAAKPSASLST